MSKAGVAGKRKPGRPNTTPFAVGPVRLSKRLVEMLAVVSRFQGKSIAAYADVTFMDTVTADYAAAVEGMRTGLKAQLKGAKS